MSVLFFLLLCVSLWLWEGKGRYQLSPRGDSRRVWRIDTKTGDVALLERDSREYLEIVAEYSRK